MSIARYLEQVRWTYNGMDWPNLNCWGLARLARHEMYGLPLLPRFDIPAQDKRSLTRACHNVVAGHLVECSPCVGALATSWSGRLCMHVAVVVEIDGRLAVLETDDGTGTRWKWLQDWEAGYLKVKYYNDR